VAGVDVGEDFLDIATSAPQGQHLRLTRVNLRNIGSLSAEHLLDENAVTLLSRMLADEVPELRSAIVLVDSPRWPSDLDWSKPGVAATGDSQHGREIDVGLRALVSSLYVAGANSTLTTLSMFPTPPMRYFGAHLNSANCKPHLRRFGQELFGQALNHNYGPASGGIFTRFMIAGFAAYRALGAIGAEAYECYPDLQFRLWCHRHRLVSKKQGRTAALASRIRVLSAVAHRLGHSVNGLRKIRRLDEADAAILALSISAAQQYGAIVILENPREGRFMVALDGPEALRFQERYRVASGGGHPAKHS
jgi:hypothetical protein